jgi:hypothetical protein
MHRCAMSHTTRAVFAVLVCAALAAPCRAQEGIPIELPPIRFEPPPVHYVPPTVPGYPGPSASGQGGVPAGPPPPEWVVVTVECVAFGIAALVILVCVVAAWRGRQVAQLRIVGTPPGEAPEEIRRAWVGVKLPLRRGETRPGWHRTEGVLSRQTSAAMRTGYSVNGRAAVKALASHSPEAAAWWRKNAPHVVAWGYRLWFPSDVCERVG